MRSLVPTPLVAFVCTVAARSDPAAAQPVTSASGTPVLSPSVVASWCVEQVGSEPPRLLFLVLYRGQPGWHRRDPSSNRQGGGGFDHSAPDSTRVPGPLWFTHRAGGVDLGMTVDGARRLLGVLDHELALDEHDVFLFGRVDGVGGPPTLVGRYRVEPRLESTVLGVLELVDGTPELRAFVGR